MKRPHVLAILLALVSGACGDDIPTIGASATDATSASGDGTASVPTTTTTASADDTAGTTAGPEPEIVFDADLDLEAKRSIHVVITQTGDTLEATVTPSEGFGVAPAGEPLGGPARIDAFPEAGATMYAARLSGPVIEGGRCGDQPVSLALALHLDTDAGFIAGGLTPYCGADTWFGVPPIEPLRISGVTGR
jgi:hypothetical protein